MLTIGFIDLLFDYLLIYNLYKEDGDGSTNKAYPEACHHLRKTVLAQNHSASAQQTCHEKDEAEPPHGIEAQILGKGKQGTPYSTNKAAMMMALMKWGMCRRSIR